MAKELLRPPTKIRTGDRLTSIEILDALDRFQRWAEQASRAINNLVSNIPSDSTATTVSDLKDDFNALLAVLRNLETR